MLQPIRIWAQMFFHDGSVTQGVRVDADIVDSPDDMNEVATSLLQSVNREEGFILFWGAGEMRMKYITSSCPSEVSAILALDSSTGFSLPHMKTQL